MDGVGRMAAPSTYIENSPIPDLAKRHQLDTNQTQLELDVASALSEGQTLFIDGEWRSTNAVRPRFDPADLDQVTGQFALATESDVADAFGAATKASFGWRDSVAPDRARVLRKAADILELSVAAAANRLIGDMGKVRADSEAEVLRSAEILRYFAGELSQPVGETYSSADPSTLLFTVEQPLGVVAAITPWNFPFAIPTWKIAPAIAFGNTVVWKPAEAASASAVFLTAVFEAAGLPAGVINLITGSGRELSGALSGHKSLSAITFTGSGTVGNVIRGAVSDRNVKVQLELGGKNPAVVLADADLQNAATQVARGAMLATGQRCTATSRVYVERSVIEEFTTRLKDVVASMKVGNPRDPESAIGPLASIEQLETVNSYLEIARDEGAEFVVGEEPHNDGGCFVEPVVLKGVDPESPLLREEIFGPVLVLVEVEDEEEGLARANDTEFGLSATIFTQDLTKALWFVRNSEAGMVHVNRETAGVEPHVPFGGLKASSSQDREQGKAARRFFTSSKTAYVKTIHSPPN